MLTCLECLYGKGRVARRRGYQMNCVYFVILEYFLIVDAAVFPGNVVSLTGGMKQVLILVNNKNFIYIRMGNINGDKFQTKTEANHSNIYLFHPVFSIRLDVDDRINPDRKKEN
jgi:hypothetical protein